MFGQWCLSDVSEVDYAIHFRFFFTWKILHENQQNLHTQKKYIHVNTKNRPYYIPTTISLSLIVVANNQELEQSKISAWYYF